MQRFNRPSSSNLAYFDSIVAAKQVARRRALLALRPFIALRYSVYMNAGEMLETIAQSPLSRVDVVDLEHCYVSPTKALDELKVAIRTSQAKVWQQLCPYCAIDTSSTFDHYLCKANFPEFAVLSDNLVPACAVCNTAKGDNELVGGQRMFVHFYVDEIPESTWLDCRIVVTGGEPEAHFEVAVPASVPRRAQEILGRHYKLLGLVDRYKAKSVQTLVETMRAAYRGTVDGYAQEFARKADRLGDIYGYNYWQSRLYDAMAKSEEFLQLLTK